MKVQQSDELLDFHVKILVDSEAKDEVILHRVGPWRHKTQGPWRPKPIGNNMGV